MTSIYDDGTYQQNNATWHVDDSPWKARQALAMLEKHGMVPKTVCEVGCGAGEILRQMSLALPKAAFTGFELSKEAFAMCQSRASERLHFYNSDVVLPGRPFDLLLSMDVFEHVEDYFGFLQSLKPKATHKIFHIPLDVSVLSVLWGSMMATRKAVGHLHYFSKDTALATLRDCDYEVIDYAYTRSFDELGGKTFTSRLALLPRKLLFAISPDMASTLLGGCSLIVLTK